MIFKEKDTLVPTATFTKGGGITGNNYISFSDNGKIYWILDKTLMKLFVYTYTYQPLEITIPNKSDLDKEKATKIWNRAKEYMDIYGKCHTQIVSEETNSDFLLFKRYYRYNGDYYLRIEKIEDGQEIKFKVTASTQKGRERTCVGAIKDNLGYNQPDNSSACAYYMQYGFFYREESLKK